jgi:hypothetical protein
MPVPDRAQLDELLSMESHCASILVPTHRAGKEVQQAKIRLKNLLSEAAGQLTGHQLRKDRIEETLRPAHELLADEGLWRSPEDGLAVYLAPGFSRVFRVPLPLEETLVVGSRFYVLPLLPTLGNRGEFFLLALSLKSVRLFAADRFEVHEVDLPGMPKSLTEAVGSDYQQAGGGRAEEEKEEATQFCLRVDAGLRRILQGAGNGTKPMVIAAAEPLASIYTHVSHYPNVLPDRVTGNPEPLSGEELGARARTIVEGAVARELESALERCRELQGTGRASSDTREIVLAAIDGRVDTLFVARRAQRWGTLDLATRRVELLDQPGPSADELLNFSAGVTVRSGGAVHLVAREAMPEQADTAAIFRY